MQNKTPIYAIVLVLFLSLGCSTNNSDEMEEISSEKFTYSKNVKPIIDSNCTSCHGNPTTNSAPMSLTTYNQTKEATENRNLIVRIENGSMPISGSLTTEEIHIIKEWKNGGYLE